VGGWFGKKCKFFCFFRDEVHPSIPGLHVGYSPFCKQMGNVFSRRVSLIRKAT